MKLNSLKLFDGFLFSDLKYLMAYSIPLTAIFGFYMGGYWLLTTPIYIFLIIPISEHLLTFLKIDDLEKGRINKSTHWIFDLMLYINIPLVYGILIYALIFFKNKDILSVEYIMGILSVGLVVVSNGINVAHELCHRSKKYEKFLGKFLLIPSLYMHFYLEHNFGHHLKVATNEDPVTAKYNQPLYSFWISAIKGEILSAIEIQRKRLDKNNLSFFSIYNDMFWYAIIQFLYILIVFTFFTFQGLIFILSVALFSILMFECVNYIEHYGLLRKKLSNGRYERVTDMHSWNSNHILGRIVLYELTRHSDHHRISVTKYQNLKSIDKSPQLPFGYPTSILLSFIPVLWFKIMNPRVPKQMFKIETNNN
jgi:alkane 1-monooxygenase